MSMTQTLDTTWGEFRLDRSVGVGGRGQVFHATDLLTGVPVAIKVLLDTPSDDPVGERFLAEPTRAARLGSRDIVRVHEASDVGGTAYVAMERCRHSLADELARGPMPLSRLHSVFRAATRAVDRAGEAGLVHRNIKPSNLLVRRSGDVVLSDFGSTFFAEALHGDRPVPESQRGLLPLFAAPETVRGEVLTSAADIYSLGAVLFFILSGRAPYDSDVPRELAEAHCTFPTPSLAADRPDLAEAFDPVIARAMTKNPAARYRCGADLLGDLSVAIGSCVARPHTRAAGPESSRPAVVARPTPTRVASRRGVTDQTDRSSGHATEPMDSPAAARVDGAAAAPTDAPSFASTAAGSSNTRGRARLAWTDDDRTPVEERPAATEGPQRPGPTAGKSNDTAASSDTEAPSMDRRPKTARPAARSSRRAAADGDDPTAYRGQRAARRAARGDLEPALEAPVAMTAKLGIAHSDAWRWAAIALLIVSVFSIAAGFATLL